MIQSSNSIEKEIDKLNQESLIELLSLDENEESSISLLDSLLIIEGVLEIYADFHIDTTENGWYD